jgi:hypothetical protein
MAEPVTTVQLKPETLQAFEAYIRQAEAEMQNTRQNGPFLWSDAAPDREKQLRNGETLAQFWSGNAPANVPDGLIHDWIGASIVPNATIAEPLALIQDYDNHKAIYAPEVIDSRLLSRTGDDFRIYLRILKKKVITVVLETDHDVHYSQLDASRWECRSYSTRIAEVEHAGTDHEQLLPPDAGYGFLWRLYSYWRMEQRVGDVYIECRAISLTRDVPLMLKWIVQPMVRKLPRESLINTLVATRQGVLTRQTARLQT